MFFHWPLEFPGVFATGGFDVVLGNPPWDKIEMDEQEFFAGRDPRIARLAGARRKAAIAELERANPRLWRGFQLAARQIATRTRFAKSGRRFPLTGVGRLNLYALFAEVDRTLLSERGRSGIIVPTGIATDDTTKQFFQDVVERGSLATLFDFENRGIFFPSVHSSYKFSLLTMSGATIKRGDLAFFLGVVT